MVYSRLDNREIATAAAIKPAIVILAAGASTRFGSPKQLAKLGNKTLLQHSIDRANALTPDPVYVVLGAHHPLIRPTVTAAEILINHQWQQGIASSITTALRHIERQHNGLFILLGDQPQIPTEALQGMLSAFDGDRIVCARYRRQRGAPVLFPASCFPALRALKGDQGAKALLQSPTLPVLEWALPEAAFDIDTPAQWAGLQENRELVL